MSSFDNSYPSIFDLESRARSRIPRFAFEYLQAGNQAVEIFLDEITQGLAQLSCAELSELDRGWLLW
jgi:hypothetical protein